MTTAARDAAEWRLRAACRGQDISLWFIDKGHYSTALTICGSCAVRAECLYDALVIEPAWHRYGIALAAACCELWWTSADTDHDPATCTRKDQTT
ncbi:WhiB family transcriptional regulator [Streptomyces sp. NBC_01092]|uniref:WhiB family transcriptional regulator n=1 Tax=Streptomyces sp. NBC_01092 TaxID=2903748 RepID=UPI00386F5EF8|nr:WhiB family transcriptional regulator [Streptomyces sp. NBC_01092]